ncbi:GAF domain-containing sensor histidine kinase [Actinoallomurus sp. NBC_01490]|uniref:GAF domain-containing sensor histidine kinase n=1 Tax=Actinoallomurus sp. NBC_01490 TaxID=2903557 RepID=UPI002E3722AD|nr:GAF domain-containing sensor histidine kinase [Actinoallomurus sp. NBC_01490]
MGVRDAVTRLANRPAARTLRARATGSTAALRSMLADRAELDRLEQSYGALRRVTTLVALGLSPTEAFTTVAGELGALLGADHAAIDRYEDDQTATVVGWWSNPRSPEIIAPMAERWPIGSGSAAALVLRTGGPVRRSSASVTGEAGAWARSHGIKHIVSCPVWVEGRLWGDVAVMFRGGTPPRDDTETRLADFVELVACTLAQAKSRADLIDSRARVIAASDATRRRIERDLHDGVQQHLVSLTFDLRAAESAMPPGEEDLREQLTNTGKGLSNAIAELQEICRGLHPGVLSKSGLRAALQTLARRSPVPVELRTEIPDSLPEQHQVTLYYIVSEALNNVAKHANASTAHVELDHDDHEIRLSVRDDGQGGAVIGPGSGLLGLMDRVDAVEGTLRLRSPAGEGTSLEVTIPR